MITIRLTVIDPDALHVVVPGCSYLAAIVSAAESVAYDVLDIKYVSASMSVLLTERFKFSDGQLTEIEAAFQYCAVTASRFA